MNLFTKQEETTKPIPLFPNVNRDVVQYELQTKPFLISNQHNKWVIHEYDSENHVFNVHKNRLTLYREIPHTDLRTNNISSADAIMLKSDKLSEMLLRLPRETANETIAFLMMFTTLNYVIESKLTIQFDNARLNIVYEIEPEEPFCFLAMKTSWITIRFYNEHGKHKMSIFN